MSLRAKIEAVIYAAEEPVTLTQLAGIFAQEVPPAESQQEEEPSIVSLIEEGILRAESSFGGDPDHLIEMALLNDEKKRREQDANANPEAAEAEAKRAARQREREVRESLKEIVDGLIEEYASSDRGMEIREVAGGYRISTKPEYHDAVRAFVKSLKPPMKLSLQALETLAVIAYKQPVTAPEVAEIRGVDSSGVLGGLISRKLITTAGRKQVIGRPILYKTTREFLLRFGLKDLNELPSIEEFEKLAGDLEIGEEETVVDEASLPFEESAESALEAVEANAGEVGLAVEAVEIPGAINDATELKPEIVALDVEAPSAPHPEGVEIASAAHPAVPIEEMEEIDAKSS